MTTEQTNTQNVQFVPDHEVIPFEREELSKHLALHGHDFDPAQRIRQFAGGFANRNYLVEIDGSLAVLRRPPAGDLPRGSHDMGREHRIISRLSKALAIVPDSLHFCDDRSILGAPFQIIEYRAGIVLRGDKVDNLAPKRASDLSKMMIEALADIHRVDTDACGLGELGRPGAFVQRAVKGWHRRGLDVAPDDEIKAAIEYVATRLSQFPFAEAAPAMLHLDFKLDNIILDPVTYTPVAVVDWDMGTRGDAIFDLSTLLSYWSQPDDVAALQQIKLMPTMQAGFWSRGEAVSYYAALTGRNVEDLDAMRILALLKLGVVFLQLDRQFQTGAVKGARYERFRQSARDLLLHVRDLSREIMP